MNHCKMGMLGIEPIQIFKNIGQNIYSYQGHLWINGHKIKRACWYNKSLFGFITIDNITGFISNHTKECIISSSKITKYNIDDMIDNIIAITKFGYEQGILKTFQRCEFRGLERVELDDKIRKLNVSVEDVDSFYNGDILLVDLGMRGSYAIKNNTIIRCRKDETLGRAKLMYVVDGVRYNIKGEIVTNRLLRDFKDVD